MNKMHEDDDVDDIEIIITTEDLKKFRRLDQFLAEKIPNVSRSLIKKLHEQDCIYYTDSDIALELKKMPPVHSHLTIEIPPEPASEAKAENIPLEILFQDEYLIMVNKPAGLVTHPGAGNWNGTLVNALLYHCPDLQGEGFRPGIVHRLDKGTSGVMVVAKTRECHEKLVTLFAERKIERYYEALVTGTGILPLGRLESSIGRDTKNRIKMAINVSGGKKAVTHFKVIKEYMGFTHMEFKLETGRTHQIRVHAASLLKHSILGDETYGNPKQQLTRLSLPHQELLKNYPYPLLHAKTLGFIHPFSQQKISFTVSPPKTFQDLLV